MFIKVTRTFPDDEDMEVLIRPDEIFSVDLPRSKGKGMNGCWIAFRDKKQGEGIWIAESKERLLSIMMSCNAWGGEPVVMSQGKLIEVNKP